MHSLSIKSFFPLLPVPAYNQADDHIVTKYYKGKRVYSRAVNNSRSEIDRDTLSRKRQFSG